MIHKKVPKRRNTNVPSDKTNYSISVLKVPIITEQNIIKIKRVILKGAKNARSYFFNVNSDEK